MRKYKRKIGGVATQPVTPQIVTESSKQTISGSLSNTYDYTKDLIRNISNYVTENFIFVLIAGVLIIFYLYLFSTEPVTQEDLDSMIVTLKCDSYTGSCPVGQEKAPSIPCVNNNCDEETCCRESFTCLSWSGTCPTGKSKVDTNPCINDEFSECGQEVCCQLDCSSDNFSSTRCPTTTTYNPYNICSGSECLIRECCDDKLTCDNIDGSGNQYNCPENTIIKSNINITCPVTEDGIECSDEVCCDDKCSKWLTEPDNNCPEGITQNNNNICPESGCTLDFCCNIADSSNINTKCSSYECPSGERIEEADTTDCVDGICTTELCCVLST